ALKAEEIEELFQAVAKDAKTLFTVDLEKKTISFGNRAIAFDLREAMRQKLLQGLDDIGWTLQFVDDIAKYEAAISHGGHGGTQK
ncbi:MAG: 3-isopropylmalate dehydratase small subunit, partial [Bacteroidetes bacterium]|nr:3-isopropylmalate dehydratase small subunit [Bacteroidota bacterium]